MDRTRSVRLIRNATKKKNMLFFVSTLPSPFPTSTKPPWKHYVFNFNSVPADIIQFFNTNASKMTVHNVAFVWCVQPDNVKKIVMRFVTGQPRRNGSANNEFRCHRSCQLLVVNAGRRQTGQRHRQHDNTIKGRIKRVASIAGVHAPLF